MQSFSKTESKFHEASEKKSLVAHEWLEKDQVVAEQIKLQNQIHMKAKAAYLFEFINYKNKVRSAHEYKNANMLDDEEVYQLIADEEMQKKKLDQAYLEFTTSLEKMNELNELRASVSLSKELKTLKMEHILVSGDHRVNKDIVTEVNRIYKKSLKLDPTTLETENLSRWRKNFRVAKNFLHAMSLSLQLRIISSKQIIE